MVNGGGRPQQASEVAALFGACWGSTGWAAFSSAVACMDEEEAGGSSPGMASVTGRRQHEGSSRQAA